MNGILKYLFDGDARFRSNASIGFYKSMPDEVYLKRYFKSRMGRELNLDNPQTFNEKLQWLKLHDRNPLYTILVDKYEVKKYVSEIIGEDHIIPTYGVWDSFDEVDFKTLPDQFVLKCTHDSGGIVICKDKKSFDIRKAKKKINRCLNNNYFYRSREWPYKDVRPRVLAEKYMSDLDGQLTDYKIHNFDGRPRVILVCQDRFGNLRETFYTASWQKLPVRRPGIPNADNDIDPPPELEEMLELSRELSQSIPFVRTDFYTINGQVYFGEYTFYPAGGFHPFIPENFDKTMGEWISLKKY